MDFSASPDATIGVFDSGIGGLSVLRALRVRIPHAHLHYVADSAHAPYGDRSVEEVVERARQITRHLLDSGARLIMAACNTATTAAIHALRAEWPATPFVGVEPGIKPAVLRSPSGRIGVLATRRTIASERMQTLVALHASHCQILLQPCPGLADAIESGSEDTGAIDVLLKGYCAPLLEAQVDTVVLGCTHYPFVADRIQAVMGPEVALIDTADAVAQRAQSLWPQHSARATSFARLRLETTGDPHVLSTMAQRWLPCTEDAHGISR